MHMEVPPAFIGYDSKRDMFAALIQWFYRDKYFTHVHGGDLLKNQIEDYDMGKGKKHNLEAVINTSPEGKVRNKWIEHWAKVLTFDAIIGNVDRHHDNWGIIVLRKPDKNGAYTVIGPSFAFDNGTSMGYEIMENNIYKYNDIGYLNRYVMRGKHHMKWRLEDSDKAGHIDLINKLIKKYPFVKDTCKKCMNFDFNDIHAVLNSIQSIKTPVSLTQERIDLMLNLLETRYNLIQNVLRD
ncbi:MAG: hypothetical protein ABIH39_05100 [Candidatus Margulisiibacteriota bacterium]